MTDTPLLTVEEVASMLQVSPKTVRRLEWAGGLAAIRLGRSVRFREKTVRDYLEHIEGNAEGRSA